MNDSTYEIEINNLSVTFEYYKKLKKYLVKPISNLSIMAKRGEILTIVGASGSGKSILAHAIMGILPKSANVCGSIKFRNKDITKNDIKKIRGKYICLIPQSTAYLNPLIKIGNQIIFKNNIESRIKMNKSFEKYGLSYYDGNLYPFQCSGGMIRKALISTVEQVAPTIIIADEPTTGVDYYGANKILKYFRDFANDGKAVIVITHDIDIALKYSDKIAVFYDGTILELTNSKNFLKGEHYIYHPYTKAIYNALPQNGFKLNNIDTYNNYDNSNCKYINMCNRADFVCKDEIPLISINDNDGFVRCVYAT